MLARGVGNIIVVASAALFLSLAFSPHTVAQNVLDVLSEVKEGTSDKTTYKIGKFIDALNLSPTVVAILRGQTFDGILTLFAPTDEVWEASGFGALDSGMLSQLLQYHISYRDVNYVLLPNAPVLVPMFLGNAPTAAPSPSWLYVHNGFARPKLMANVSSLGPSFWGIEPLDAFFTDNCLVYIMPTPLIPPLPFSLVLASLPETSIFLSTLRSADATGELLRQLDTISNPGASFFVPTNDAIQTHGGSFWQPGSRGLAELIRMHVVRASSRPLYASRMAEPIRNGPFTGGLREILSGGRAQTHQSLGGIPLTLTAQNGGIYIDGVARIVRADVLCAQGVIHLIDRPIGGTSNVPSETQSFPVASLPSNPFALKTALPSIAAQDLGRTIGAASTTTSASSAPFSPAPTKPAAGTTETTSSVPTAGSRSADAAARPRGFGNFYVFSATVILGILWTVV